MNKKGQAAMDFLMTYGWAILVVLIVIGILAYFVKPSSLAPNKAQFDGTTDLQIPAHGYTVKSTGATQIAVSNTGGTDFKNATLYVIYGNKQVTCSPNPITLSAGSQQIFNCTVDPGKAGDTFDGTLKLEYTAEGISHTSTGSIRTKYE